MITRFGCTAILSLLLVGSTGYSQNSALFSDTTQSSSSFISFSGSSSVDSNYSKDTPLGTRAVPSINAGGAVNAATFGVGALGLERELNSALAPGVIFSIFGTGMTDGSTEQAQSVPLPTQLAGARVLVQGIAAPLFFASPQQINAQFPVELQGITSATIHIEVTTEMGTVVGPSITVDVNEYSPGIFTLDQNGSGPGAILRSSDFSLICPPGRNDCAENHAIGGQVVSIFMTGLGPVDGPFASGVPAIAAAPTLTTPLARIGYEPPVLYSGLAPGFVGLYQVNVLLPLHISSDEQFIRISMGGRPRSRNPFPTSNYAFIAIKKPDRILHPGGGPEGGLINSLAVDPTNSAIIYAATDSGGVFKSVDGGDSWNAANSGLTDPNVDVLAIAPSSPETIYAGTDGGGVFKSVNGGQDWVPINDDLSWRHIHALAVHPDDPAILYAGGTYLYKGGPSWERIECWPNPGSGPLPRCVNIRSLAIDPTNPDNIYVGTDGDGVILSKDGGETWQFPGPGTDFASSGTVSSLVFDPTNPSVLYATSFTRVVKSSDGGRTWTGTSCVGQGSNGACYDLLTSVAIDPNNPSTLYAGTIRAGVAKSTDGGQSWTLMNAGISEAHPPGHILSLAVSSADSNSVLAGTFGAGVMKSVNSGASWSRSSSGLTASWVQGLAVDPSNPSHLFAGVYRGGVIQTNNSGQSWDAVSNAYPVENEYGFTALYDLSSLLIDPTNPSNIFAGGPSAFSFLKSTDTGQNWALVHEYLSQPMAIDPSNPDVL